jgi:predicted alpha-1,2-mannosidase
MRLSSTHKKWLALSGFALTAFASIPAISATQYAQYVDPRIGTDANGSTTIGPSRPYALVKPGPDNIVTGNNGYVVDPKAPIFGFSQMHVSGTGGGPKYGNISIMPFMSNAETLATTKHTSLRTNETAALGYYAALLTQSNIKAEITSTSKAAMYRFTFNNAGDKGIKIDAGKFLNDEPVPKGTYLDVEQQHFIGSEIEVISDTEVRGYNRVRGGWNIGGPYTVYFHAVFDKPFKQFKTWNGDRFFDDAKFQVDTAEKTGALLSFKDDGDKDVQVKIGISFISTGKAKLNLDKELSTWKFDDVVAEGQQVWDKLLGRIEIDKNASDKHKRMVYTGLYHTMLMPVDKTGENALWKSDKPYYDDFYAIWDTFRSSHPLITLIDPQRQTDIVNAMLDIYKHDGYMPDARSGDSNGRTQGGSNPDVLIADAYVKGLKGIDYELGLEAMLKNADVPPGGNEEKEGRGGLYDYNRLGYVSNNFDRAGTRTLEYAYNDFNIALVAKGLGKQDVFKRFAKQANNWQNLWRDIPNNGARGFIMPKDANGKWLDEITCTVKPSLAKNFVPLDPGTIQRGNSRVYAPTDLDKGSCVCWWCSFLYEGNSWEYSLYVPHDPAELIKRSGGAAAFEKRLDILFDKPYYNVGNEPSFFSPNLYHWIGKPERSSERITQIVNQYFNDTPKGIPGNDDSGAMSSFMVFHMIGIYPNAGQSYYLINAPFFAEVSLNLASGKKFKIVAKNFSSKNPHIKSAKLNGKDFPRSWIEHAEIEAGGVLELEMADKPAKWGKTELPPSLRF